MDEIVPAFNATDAMNILALSMAPELDKGDYVVLTKAEHHSSIMPWRYVCKPRKCGILWVDVGDYGEIDLRSLEDIISSEKRIKAIVAVHVSNVNGVINPLREICRIASSEGCILFHGSGDAFMFFHY